MLFFFSAFCYHIAMPPFYVQLVLLSMGASLLFCVLLYAFGKRPATVQPLYRENAFPTVWDTIYTAWFILVFVVLLALNLPMNAAEEAMAKENVPVSSLLFSMLLQAAIYIPMVVRFALLPKRERESMGFWRGTGWVALTVFGVLCVCAAMTQMHVDKLIMELTGSPEQQEVVQSMMDGNAAQKLILAVAAIVMAPIGEEVCFRGFIYNILRGRAGVWGAAMATGLLFGVVHCSLVQLLPLTVFGILQCLLYERSKTLLLPMAVHAVFNSLNVMVILLLPYLPEAVKQGM